jgi:predicted NAD-dependent protein-ADP-ribosyltransferase YbiA (DUF1768 family)
MELYPADVERLKRMLEEWSQHETRELEATFSAPSDTTTFLSVAQRLAAKGYQALPQEDKLNIITPEHIRFTLTGIANIQKYCNDDEIATKEFEVMIKDRAGVESNIDIKEYGVRIKVRREMPLTRNDPPVAAMLARWSSQRKAFRIIRRYTFMGKGVRFDISMVRSTPTDEKGSYKYQTKFQQRDLTRDQPKYEIEVELLRPDGSGPEVVQKALKELVAGIGEVLRGIQKHTFLIRKSTALKAINEYKALLDIPPERDARFRGVAPITMEKENFMKKQEEGVANIRTGYNVTDKADGLRMMGFVDDEGELFMIDMSLNIYRTGLSRLACARSLVDGEYITRDKDGKAMSQFALFDMYVAPGKIDVSQKPFIGEDGREAAMRDWTTKWGEGSGPTIIPGAGVTEKNKIAVVLKTFIVADPGDTQIFQACASVLSSAKPYHTDGLIITPNTVPIPQGMGVGWHEQLKWKPAEENTVDFLVLFDKEAETNTEAVIIGVKPGTGESVRYKVMRLYVGTNTDPAYEDPRGTVLFEQALPGTRGLPKKDRYKPILFNPKEVPDTMAAVSYLPVELDVASGEEIVRCENGDPIQDKSIVECRYEAGDAPGWRWRPMRIRYDKTERYQRGILGRTLNKDESAEGVWNSIHDPITEHMIRTGSEAPSKKEIAAMSGAVRGVATGTVAKIYYDRTAAKEDIELIRGLRSFHRLYVKEDLLLGTALRGGGKVLVDLACGQGGDLMTWVRNKVEFVYGTDIAGFGIRDPQNGAYRRYINSVMKTKGGFESAPKMIFTIGSSAQVLKTGDAGSTPEEQDIMRCLYNGRGAAQGPVPPFVEKYGDGKLSKGADAVAIMFAIHYFFENEVSLSNFIQNVSDSLRMGGLFIGCCFDGEAVFNALRGIDEGGALEGEEGGAKIWKITKRYSNTDLTTGPESIGLPIDVEFISIGTQQREFLVPFEMLKERMAGIGCDLLTDKECRELGLQNSTNMFEESYRMATEQGKKYPMSAKVRQYSFFNRWFIFKRRREGPLDTALEVAVEEAEENIVYPVREEGAFATAAQRAAKETAETLEALSGEAPKPTVAKPKATVAAALEEKGKKKYALKDLFKISIEAKFDDKQLGINDPYAARWISPMGPFPITDTDSTKYPTLEHFLAAKKYQASNKPELGALMFGQEGTIHQEFLRQRQVESAQGTKALDDRREYELFVAEWKRVKEELTSAAMKRHKATLDDAKWIATKDTVLEEGLKQRWEKDARLRKIVEAVRTKGLYILYDTGAVSGSELGGKRTADGTIDGENKVGMILMRLAKFRGI